MKPVFEKSLETLRSEDSSDKDKISAINLSAFSPNKNAETALLSILTRSDAPKLYLPVIRSLQKRKSAALAKTLIKNWKIYPASVRAAAVSVFLETSAGTIELLNAIEAKKLPENLINDSQIGLLRKSKNAEVRSLVAKIYPPQKMIPRSNIVAKYQGALKLKGNAANGKTVFATSCASCHKSGADGFQVGPDLATFKTAGNESIISNIFDPNKEVAPQYQSYVFTLKSGEQFLGIIVNETTTEVTVRQAFGVEKTFPRTEVKAMKSMGQSLMPEGLESVLTEQSLADLLAFIAG